MRVPKTPREAILEGRFSEERMRVSRRRSLFRSFLSGGAFSVLLEGASTTQTSFLPLHPPKAQLSPLALRPSETQSSSPRLAPSWSEKIWVWV